LDEYTGVLVYAGMRSDPPASRKDSVMLRIILGVMAIAAAAAVPVVVEKMKQSKRHEEHNRQMQEKYGVETAIAAAAEEIYDRQQRERKENSIHKIEEAVKKAVGQLGKDAVATA
jgi:hypothetical protein